MQTKRRIYRVLSAVTLLTLLLSGPLAAAPMLSKAEGLASPGSNAGWKEVGTGSATGGGISDNSGNSIYPVMSVSSDGTPYVAWSDNSDGDYEIYMLRWNGTHWEEVGTGSASGGGISNDSALSHQPSLASAPDGTLYLAWENGPDGGADIYILRWNGSNWEEVGTGSASGGGISNNGGHSAQPSMAVAPDGTPYVAWWDRSGGDPEIYVRRWNGSSWEEVGAGSASGGGISNDSSNSYVPAIALTPAGTPYIAWHDYPPGPREIYVRRWNGSSWEEVGAGSATGGGISNNGGDSPFPHMAITPDGVPYVAWYDNSDGDYEVYVRRWNGSIWEEVGAGSATGGGISNNGSDSAFPRLAITPDGVPYVTWYDYSDGNHEVYVRRWNGSSWEEVGIGSATGGGISNNGGHSQFSWPAIASDGTLYIAWHDNSSGDREIYVRRFAPSDDPILTAFQTSVTVDEGHVANNSGTVSDPDNDPVALDASVGTMTNNGDGTWSWSFTTSDGPTESQTVTISADDGKGGTAETTFDLTINNVAPTVGLITAPVDPVQVNTEIYAEAGFTDPGVLDTHTAVWDWGDGITSPGTLSETGGSGSVSGSHTYATPGVYTIKLTVTDKDGDSGESIFQYVVAYDPEGGSVTGGGWINSPAGAYPAEPSLTGKASFGFASKYKKGASVPTGQTRFQFKLADLKFHSDTYDWLVVSGAWARYKGVGTINGEGEYKFMLTAFDADINENDAFDVDRYQIKIWYEDAQGNETIVYDNGLGADDTDNNATTEIGGGSITIRQK